MLSLLRLFIIISMIGLYSSLKGGASRLEREEESFLVSPSLSSEEASRAYSRGVMQEKEGNREGAKIFYDLAASNNHTPAHYALGVLALEDGNVPEASRFWSLAANQGHPCAQNDLGTLHKLRGEMQDAKRLYTLAATQGHPYTAYNLGALYDEEGQPEDAEKYYSQAAHQGLALAQNNLGVLYYRQGNQEKALKLWSDAAAQGLECAHYNLESLKALESQNKPLVRNFDVCFEVLKRQRGICLKTERLFIAPFHKADLARYREIEKDDISLLPFSWRKERLYTLAQGSDFELKDPFRPYSLFYLDESEGFKRKLIGYISLAPFTLQQGFESMGYSNLTYIIDRPFRGRGFGSEALHALVKTLLPEFLQKDFPLCHASGVAAVPLLGAQACIDIGNSAAVKMALKAGLQPFTLGLYEMEDYQTHYQIIFRSSLRRPQLSDEEISLIHRISESHSQGLLISACQKRFQALSVLRSLYSAITSSKEGAFIVR